MAAAELHHITRSYMLNIDIFFTFLVTNGSYSQLEEEEDSELYGHRTESSGSPQDSYLQDRFVGVYAFFSCINAMKSAFHMNEIYIRAKPNICKMNN